MRPLNLYQKKNLSKTTKTEIIEKEEKGGIKGFIIQFCTF